MGARIIISEIDAQEQTESLDKLNQDIILTDFSILKIVKKVVEAENDDFLTKNIYGFELFGKYNIYDKSSECLAVDKFSDWAKLTAHEEKVYKTVNVLFTDNNNQPYDTISLEKAFVVQYKERCKHTDSIIEYYAFIKNSLELELCL